MELIIRDLETGTQLSFRTKDDIENAKSTLCLPRIRPLVFVTGNNNKVNELRMRLDPTGIRVTSKKIDLLEIQDYDVLNIAQEKCKQAYEHINKGSNPDNASIVLVEDVSLNFKALNGLPGPYIKWFVEALKPEGLYKMLHGFEDKSAQAVCIYALMDRPSRVIFCKGTVDGQIISPRGSSWGWDPVFEDKTTGKTYGEMSAEIKAKHSHRGKAIEILESIMMSP